MTVNAFTLSVTPEQAITGTMFSWLTSKARGMRDHILAITKVDLAAE